MPGDCRHSDTRRSDAVLPFSSQEQPLPSPQVEYLPYDLESIATPLVRENYKSTLQRCMGLLQLNAVQRMLSAIVLAPLVTAFLWFSPAIATSTVCSFVASVCSYEYAWLSNRIRLRILTRLEALEGVWDEDFANLHRSNEIQLELRTNGGTFVSSRTAEGDATSGDRTSLSQSRVIVRECSSDTKQGTVRERQIALRSPPTHLRLHRQEDDITLVDDGIHDQEARPRCHAVSELAIYFFYGNDKVAAACFSVAICAVLSTLFLVSAQNFHTLQTTEFYESRWLYAIATSYAAGFCACMAPDWSYAVTIVVQYGVFTLLAMHSTGCSLNDFSCGIGLDPDVAVLVGTLALLVCRFAVCRAGVEAFVTFMLDVLGLSYIAGTLSVLVAFVDDERRSLYRKLLIALLYIVWASDTGAYITGKTLQLAKYPYYHPLAAHLSKYKDYEGTFGAIAFGVGAMLVVSDVLELPGSVGTKLGFTVMAVIVGRVGDLFESLLKRAAEVKDSGSLIPGHGGMLDRIDALMFASLVFSRYYSGED